VRRKIKTIVGSRKHQLIAAVSILLVAVALIAAMVACEEEPPISEIRTWHDLDAIRDNLGGHYILMNDLDSTTEGYEELASEIGNEGRGWQPIGTEEHSFTGIFDGQNHGIRDLFINRSGEDYVGLFSFVDKAGCIEHLGVVNAIVTGKDGVGGLVGICQGTVNNCYFAGNVSGINGIGGLVGESFGTVSKAYAMGSVTGNYSVVGGLTGLDGGTVNNSYATGSVTGYEYVGGLVGLKDGGGVNDSYATGSVTGYEYVGGLMGYNHGMWSGCFWDTITSGQATSDGGTGKATMRMKNITTFSGSGAVWDIVAVANPSTRDPSYIWNIVNYETYPFLSWQSVS
jgi:hypothetical protein